MNRRITALALCLLYFTLAIVAGTLPHNHSGGSLLAHKDCSACALHINGVADVPVAIVAVANTAIEFKTFHFDVFTPSAFFFLTSASRAPPHTSA